MIFTLLSRKIKIKVKVKTSILVIAPLTRVRLVTMQRFTILEVAADWHELSVLQRITRPSIAMR